MKELIIFLFTVTSVFAQDSNNVKIIKKINELRVSKGLDTLKYDESLFLVGKDWSKYILHKINNFSVNKLSSNHYKNPMFLHINYNSRFDQVLKRKDVFSIGENINLSLDIEDTNNIIDHAFDCWKKSSNHYNLMVKKEQTNVAFSFSYSKKTKRMLCILVISENIK